MTDKFFEKVGTAKRSRPGALLQTDAPTPAVPKAPENMDGRRWTRSDQTYWQARESVDRLPSAVYTCNHTDMGPTLQRLDFDIDDLLELPDCAGAEVLEEIRRFWDLKAEFRARGFTHKTGVLLWGPPGSGKSSTIQLLISAVVRDHKGIGVMVDHPGLAISCLQVIRKIEPRRPIVALLEDFDALVERHGETAFLAMLDGEARVGNIVHVAATNYPERLDARFVDRPSRFSLIKEIGMPSAAARQVYLTTKEPSLKGDELARWVEVSEGFSIDHLREMIVLCRCHRMPLELALARLNAMRQDRPASSKTDDGRGNVVGFR